MNNVHGRKRNEDVVSCLGKLGSWAHALNSLPVSEPKWLWFWDTSTGLPGCTQISLSIYSFWEAGRASQRRSWRGKPGREGRKGVEFFVSLLQALEQLAIILGDLGCSKHAQGSGLEICRCFLATSFSHSHSLSNHDTFSVNEKTNIQDIRMLLRRHYRQLLMATLRPAEKHTLNICIFSVLV